MHYIKCQKCGKLNQVTIETLLFCSHCNKKLENNFRDWHKLNENLNFEDFKNAQCIFEKPINKVTPPKIKIKKKFIETPTSNYFNNYILNGYRVFKYGLIVNISALLIAYLAASLIIANDPQPGTKYEGYGYLFLIWPFIILFFVIGFIVLYFYKKRQTKNTLDYIFISFITITGFIPALLSLIPVSIFGIGSIFQLLKILFLFITLQHPFENHNEIEGMESEDSVIIDSSSIYTKPHNLPDTILRFQKELLLDKKPHLLTIIEYKYGDSLSKFMVNINTKRNNKILFRKILSKDDFRSKFNYLDYDKFLLCQIRFDCVLTNELRFYAVVYNYDISPSPVEQGFLIYYKTDKKGKME